MVNDRNWLWFDFYFIAIDLCPCRTFCHCCSSGVRSSSRGLFAGAFMSIDKPKLQTPVPIGSMYGIYANIWGILMVNVTIYGIHGSYGVNARQNWALWTSTIWALSSLLREFGPAITFSGVHVYHKHGMPFKDLRMAQTYLAPNWIVEW